MRFVALRDTFAESGTPEGLLEKYGLTAADIVREALELVGSGSRASRRRHARGSQSGGQR